MDKLTLRRMTESDLEKVLEIEKASFHSPWSEGAFRYEIQNNTISYPMVGEKNGELAGYVIGWLVTDELHIADIAVDEKFRGQGIGDKLLRGIIYIGIKKGVVFTALEVRPSNIPALHLYYKYKFTHVGTRKKYYSNGEDAMVLALTLKELPDISDLIFQSE